MTTGKWTTENIGDLDGKTILVTGGNTGLGYASVKAFAEKGAQVILASRSEERGEAAKSKILQGSLKGSIDVLKLDLMDLSSIRAFAEKVNKDYSRLDVLLNNAGIMTTPFFKTKDGFEAQLGTNHLGHFALTGLLLDLLKNTPNSRVVNVSSIAHKNGKMDFDNLLFENGGYSPMKSYGQSKLSNLLFTYELQRYFEKNKIDTIAVAAHPGVSQTELSRHLEGKFWFKLMIPLFKLLSQSPAQGALPQIRASVDPDVKATEYYGPDGFNEMKGYPVLVDSTPQSKNVDDAKKLWAESEKLTKVTYK